MKILHIYDSDRGEKALAGESSPSTVVFYISKYLAEKGQDITVLERKYIETDPPVEYIDGVKFVRLEAKKRADIPFKEMKKFPFGPLRLILDGIEFAVKINRFLKENDFDVIHVHFPFAANVLINLNRRIREKMVYTLHIGEEEERLNLDSDKETSLLLRLFSPDLYLMNRIKKSVVLNESLRSKLISKNKIKPENITVIHNGININELNPNINIRDIKEKYVLNGKISILFTGNIIPRKGIEYIVKAADILINELDYDNTLFLIAGNLSLDEVYVEKIKRLIKNYELEGNVNLLGFLPYEELKKMYVACDIFALPSFGEGDSIALKEALASGKPLIGTNIGGIVAQIEDGWNGFHIEPGNEKQLAEKIKYLIENEEERGRMGKNSRILAEEEFDWKKIADRYLNVYEVVVR
jgi:glycosyltransferase involved in cell wall biosynthesis